MKAIGLMSGTSLDGVDVALVDIYSKEDSLSVELLKFQTYDYPAELLSLLKKVINDAQVTLQEISYLNFALGELYSQCCLQLCAEASISCEELSFIASHGQTLYHQPEKQDVYTSNTFQVGESAIIAQRLQTTVVSNFREADMAAGGQGAPIVPFSEILLYRTHEKNRILQNIGGIGNLTFIKKDAQLEDVIAFDTGPGNMIIDALTKHFFNQAYDKDGSYGERGMPNRVFVEKYMNMPYFKQPFPKTTGREMFGQHFVEQILQEWSMSPVDFIASATLFTAKSIAYHVKQLVNEQTELIVGGGGAYNLTLLKMLREELPASISVITQEDLGISSDAKEAVAMAILGKYTLEAHANNVPNATGANSSVILGKITLY